MASPFSVFRKNQKMMIATLAILAMGAFVFLDPLTSLLRRRSGASGVPDNPVVIDWADGKVRRWDLERMLQMRNIVNYFVRRAAELGDLASGQERRSIMGFGPATEQNVVRTMVFAKAAEDFGFIVSDQVVNRFIKQITRDSVPAQRLREIIATTSIGRRRVSMGMLFDGLREELLAQELLSNYMMVASSVLPAERWIMWLRLNERATVEALPVPVSEFLDEVAEPGDVELRAFFEQYKERVKRPVAVDGTQLPSPTPGFKIPRQVVLHYLRAEFDPFVERLAAEITTNATTSAPNCWKMIPRRPRPLRPTPAKRMARRASRRRNPPPIPRPPKMVRRTIRSPPTRPLSRPLLPRTRPRSNRPPRRKRRRKRPPRKK